MILGPGAAGKSTLAAWLGEITGLPVIELDTLFWRAGLTATSPAQWAAIQRKLVEQGAWIMDGDLGPYDVLDVRAAGGGHRHLPGLPARALRLAGGPAIEERADFWRWLWSYRRRSRPLIRQAIAAYAGHADLHVLATPRAVKRFVATAGRSGLHGSSTALK